MPHSEKHRKESVLFNGMPEIVENSTQDTAFMEKWNRIHSIRDDVKKALELARSEKVIGSSLDAKLTLFATNEMYEFLSGIKNLREIFIVSDFVLENKEGGNFKGEQNIGISVEAAGGKKCARCWTYSETVGKDDKYGDVCERCAKVLKELE